MAQAHESHSRPSSTASSFSLKATIAIGWCFSTSLAFCNTKTSFIGTIPKASPSVHTTLPIATSSAFDVASSSNRALEVGHLTPSNGPKNARTKDEEAHELFYAPFWEWQLKFMAETLTDLEVMPSVTVAGNDVSYRANADKNTQIVNLHFRSKEYSKIHMTYYDAGSSIQVFNSAWYPAEGVDAPILGADLLAFNKKKFLAVVDFQPLHNDESKPVKSNAEKARIEKVLQPIRSEYPSLQGQMSSRIYDSSKFFSQQMLYSRFEDETVLNDDVLPAFQRYVKAHVNLVTETASKPPLSTFQRRYLEQRIQEHDTYCAERAPGAKIFASVFGTEWAHDFIHGFLFSKSSARPQR